MRTHRSAGPGKGGTSRRAGAAAVVAGVVFAGVALAGPSVASVGQSAPTAPVAPAGPAIDWSPVAVQPPPGGLSQAALVSLGNITCISNADCVAAGYLEVPGPGQSSYPPKGPEDLYRPVLWHWDGHTWSYQVSGTPGSVGLVGTACVSASDCWAVGGRFVGKLGNQSVGVILHYGGKSWSPATFPSPAGAAFNGVACPSASNCLVVGTRQTSAEAAHVLVEEWDGKAWSTMSAPSPQGALWSVMESLNCSDATDCLALGNADDSSKGPGYFFAEKFNGISWSRVTLQSPEPFNMGNASGLFEISCPSQTDCLAVGGALAYTHGEMGADFPGGVAESWNGTSWSAVKPTPQVDQGNLVLNGVSCISGDNCWVAMGFPSILGPLGHAIPVAHWNGSSFSVTTLKTKGFLAGISCLPENVGTWCIAIGEAPAGTKGTGAAMIGGDFLIASGPLRGAPKP